MYQRGDYERERKDLTVWAQRATGAYAVVLFVLACMVFFGEIGLDQFLFMNPNEVGDLLAGIAGPFALIWLVYGYLLQGIAIRQQAEHIALGAKALGIQAVEMDQLKKRRSSEISPNFNLRSVDTNNSENGCRKIDVEITNSGEMVRKVEFLFLGTAGIDDPPHIAEIGKGHSARMSIRFDESFKRKVQFLIRYIDRDGDVGEKSFEMEIQRVHSQHITGIAFHAVLD